MAALRCNICGSETFKDVGKRKGVLCAQCGSYERTRLMMMMIEKRDLAKNARILHLAPEFGLYKALAPKAAEYVTADIDLERYAHIPGIQHLDLCDADAIGQLGTFDLILHSHVIEHLPCNYTAVLLHLHRLLNPGGFHLFSVPIYGAHYEEDLKALEPEHAEQRFWPIRPCSQIWRQRHSRDDWRHIPHRK